MGNVHRNATAKVVLTHNGKASGDRVLIGVYVSIRLGNKKKKQRSSASRLLSIVFEARSSLSSLSLFSRARCDHIYIPKPRSYKKFIDTSHNRYMIRTHPTTSFVPRSVGRDYNAWYNIY